MWYGTFWEPYLLWDEWHSIFGRDNQWDHSEYFVSILFRHSQLYGGRSKVVDDQLRTERKSKQISSIVDHISRSIFDSSNLGHHIWKEITHFSRLRRFWISTRLVMVCATGGCYFRNAPFDQVWLCTFYHTTTNDHWTLTSGHVASDFNDNGIRVACSQSTMLYVSVLVQSTSKLRTPKLAGNQHTIGNI